MSQDIPGGSIDDDEEEAPPTNAMPERVPTAPRSAPGSGPPAEPRKPSLPPVPASVPRPTTSRSARSDGGVSQPPPAMVGGAAGSNPPAALAPGAVPPAPRAPHIEAYDSEVTTEYDPFGDDAPTADYDPRARGIYSSSSGHGSSGHGSSGHGSSGHGSAGHASSASAAGSAGAPSPFQRAPVSGPPPVPSLASDRPARPSAPPRPSVPNEPPSSQRRRSSRRTVRIPNDVNERAAYRPGASSVPAAADGSEYDSFSEADIIKPMPILAIGSQPPSRMHTPAGSLPAAPAAASSAMPMGAHPPMQPPGMRGPSAHEDYEQGWTPLPSAVSDSQETLPIMPAVTDAMLAEAGMIPPGTQARLQEARAQDARMQDAFGPSIETIEEPPGSESEPELELIEAEERTPAPPPPPPPPKPAKATPPITPPAAPPAAPPAGQTAPARAHEEATAKKVKPWWEDLFGDDYIRTLDRLDHKHVLRETNFIEESLGLERGAVILDLACGEGQHSVELAARGYSVVGFDLSLPMLSRAADEAQERQQKINFLHGDMREMAFDEMFDGIFCWSTSFGYFDDERNYAVLQRIHRALRQGGNFLLDVVNRDYVASRAPSLVWFEGEGCTCMDDMHVDFFTSRLRVKRTAMFDDGHSRELDYSIRLYTLHELGKMLHEVGFKVVEVTGHPAHAGVFFGAESPRMIILAERA